MVLQNLELETNVFFQFHSKLLAKSPMHPQKLSEEKTTLSVENEKSPNGKLTPMKPTPAPTPSNETQYFKIPFYLNKMF